MSESRGALFVFFLLLFLPYGSSRVPGQGPDSHNTHIQLLCNDISGLLLPLRARINMINCSFVSVNTGPDWQHGQLK